VAPAEELASSRGEAGGTLQLCALIDIQMACLALLVFSKPASKRQMNYTKSLAILLNFACYIKSISPWKTLADHSCGLQSLLLD